MIPCDGPLLWHNVPADDRFGAAGILECCQCGYIVLTGSLLDDAHRDVLVLSAD